MELTRNDRRLIKALQSNARRTVSELARELDLSRTTVQKRLARLETSGVIAGYKLKLGDSYESSTFQAYVNLVVDPRLSNQVAAALQRMPEVEALYTEGLNWLLKDSAMLPQLQELEARGVELLVCKTCVKECGLQDELGAGTMESDDRIIELMWNADHVVVV